MSTPVAGSVVDSGAYIVQPTGAPPKAKALTIMMPPASSSQNDNALMRGKAILSAAPRLERHDVVGQPRGHGHHEQEDHDHGVHAEDLVVGGCVQELQAGHGQLPCG